MLRLVLTISPLAVANAWMPQSSQAFKRSLKQRPSSRVFEPEAPNGHAAEGNDNNLGIRLARQGGK
eukprot:4293875-Alexandrium_andersonii.AAC.1